MDAPETAPAATPVEGDATPVTDPAVEGAPAPETPAEGAPPEVEKTPEELAAEADAKKAADAKFLEELPALLEKIPEAERRRLGQKYANGTMAAARRAERAAQSIASENAQLKAKLAEREGAPDLRKDPAAALRAAGFASMREFLDYAVDRGEGKKPDPIDEVGKLRKEIDEERARLKEQAQQQAIEAARTNIANAIKADQTRWARASSRTGQEILWGEIVEYNRAHGSCPDEAIYYLADQVERELRAEFGEPAPRAAARPSTAPAQGAAGARSSARAATVTNRSTSSAPSVREYSLDLEERRRQVTEDLRAEGLLKAAVE